METREKRRAVRLPVPVYIEAFSGSFPIGTLKNISSHGLFIQSTEPKEVGTRMELSLKLPESDSKIHLTAEVVWVNHPPSVSDMEPEESDMPTGKSVAYNPGMGLRILSASPRDLDLLQRYLTEPKDTDRARPS